MRLPLYAALSLMLLTTGCGSSFGSASFIGTSNDALYAQSAPPKTKQEFVREVSSRGVKLTEAQLEVISKGRSVLPNGTFAPRPAHQLTSEQNLDIHFRKHAREFSPNIASAQEYLERAMDLAAGKRGGITFYFDTESFAKGYQSNVVRWNPQTKEMTALRPDGAVTTYYINNRLAGKRFVVVPQF